MVMRKVKAYLHTLANSFIPHPKFYGHIIKMPMRFTYQFFFVTCFFLYLIYIIVIALKIVPPNEFLSDYRISKSLASYPPNYAVHIDNGVLTSSSDHPTFVWMEIYNTKNPLLVVDDRASADKINEYSSQVLLTGTEAVYRNYADPKLNFVERFNKLFFGPKYQQVLALDKAYSNNGLLMIPYKSNAVIGHDQISQNISGIKTFFSTELITGPLLLALVTILFVLISGGVIYLLQPHRRKQLHIHYAKIIQVSLHAAALPMIILLLLRLLYPSTNHALTFGIVIFIFSITAVYEAYYDHPHSSS